MTPQWYTAKCLYWAEHNGPEPPHLPLYETRYLLISAPDEDGAMEKALQIAKDRQHSYLNQYGATVSWKLKQVLEVKEIFNFELKDGMEIYHEYTHAPQSPL